VSLTRSEAVLELGKKMVAHFEAGGDLLASWMAHYVAQLIDAAEKAPQEAQGIAQEACAKAILELWRHRSSLPTHLRPLGELEPIQRTLALLDVDRTDFRYYPAALREAATADADEAAKQWLKLAIGIDYSARLLIGFALRSAADRAASQVEPWVELALQAGVDEGPESFIVRFIRGADEESDLDEDEQDAALLNKASKLESFAELASVLAHSLRGELSPEHSEEE
jgi:hypothetical protein